MKKSTYVICGLSILCLVLLFGNFKQSNTTTNLPLNEMSAGGLLDVKINYDNQIQELKDKRQEVIDLYNVKRGFVKTGNKDTGSAIDMVNEQLGL